MNGLACHTASTMPVVYCATWASASNNPRRRVREREEGAICEVARARLSPDQKRGRRRQATIAVLDEAGFLLQSLNRRTWAPSGVRPMQYASQRQDRLSVIGSVSLSPR